MPVAIPVVAFGSALIRMAVAPVPVFPLLAGIQPPVIAVGIAWTILVPINAVGAILVAVPAMIIAMVGIVVTHRTASGGYGCNKGESENEWRYGVQYSFHVPLLILRDFRAA
jgi:hypothetical protein